MPELPEVEVIRRGLAREVERKTIVRVDVTRDRSIRRHADTAEFTAPLVGATIRRVGRHGKFLVLRLDVPHALVVHLGMSGQLRRAASADEPLVKHTHVVCTFATGDQLRFVDPRTFGQMYVTAAAGSDTVVAPLAHLGTDALDRRVSCATLGPLLARRHVKVKTLLMDQTFVAGIGNIYSDEILFAAGVRWDRTADSLSAEEVARLVDAIGVTLRDAVRHGGSSLADAQYVDVFGRPGRYQHRHRVYAREGMACTRCDRPVERARFTNRSTFFCPTCQT
jgi:formamidopyrimidine-DNA glycosylase